ncbi:hypothetical protein CRENPOLYSF2_3640010 [Crenothrix polyspora]|uniref:Uncharacterized protein n=1 Tax=Crenothrix polyspora TaxID=360316 RepID=A0A1R4HC69_9GAMM|nr:hypothetical protein [Crenothrix polyspora]SJM93835.1 hypothetical protein CRENPOLYSF2_3640010 [Crenothrix polyspora]
MGQFIKFGLCTKIICSEKEKNKIEKYYNKFKDFFHYIYNGEHLKIYCDDIYEDIKTKQNVHDLIEFAEEKPYQNFQLSYSSSRLTATFMTNIYIEYEYIVLFLNGKAYMECYSEFFSYLEKLLRARHVHPQIGAMKIFLD